MVLGVAAEALFVPVTPIVFALHRPSGKLRRERRIRTIQLGSEGEY
jgi:hypothetical protein